MRVHAFRRGAARAESGYVMIMIMFFLALLILGLAKVTPTILSSVQREKETEMVWRGKQYARGVRMYYQKMRRFPTSLDDLTKPQMGIRFMRRAYTDPMNQVDGSWRLIYVGPSGQLIGSLNPHTTGLAGITFASGAGIPQPGGAPAGTLVDQGFAGGANPTNSSPFVSSQLGANNQLRVPVNNQANSTTSALSANTTDLPSGSNDASNILGGRIIGVGSKVDKKSFMVYEKADNYRLFEFVWDPAKDVMAAGSSTGIGKPIENPNGFSNPAGVTTNSPFASGSNPGQTPNANSNSGTNLPPNQTAPPESAPPNQTSPPESSPPNR